MGSFLFVARRRLGLMRGNGFKSIDGLTRRRKIQITILRKIPPSLEKMKIRRERGMRPRYLKKERMRLIRTEI